MTKYAKRWDNGIALSEPDIGDVATATIALGTTITNIFTQALNPGTYKFEAEVWLVNVGAPTGLTVTPAFSGTAPTVGYRVIRDTGAATAVEVKSAFAASASSVWVAAYLRGLFVVTAAGTFTIGATRTGGTSATVQVGSFLELYQISA